MDELCSHKGDLPAPTAVVWESLVNPRQPGTRAWLNLLPGEVEPTVLAADKPSRVVWSSLWLSRPHDEIHLELADVRGGSRVRFTLLTADEVPNESETTRIRRRMNHLLFADLRLSYGQ